MNRKILIFIFIFILSLQFNVFAETILEEKDFYIEGGTAVEFFLEPSRDLTAVHVQGKPWSQYYLSYYNSKGEKILDSFLIGAGHNVKRNDVHRIVLYCKNSVTVTTFSVGGPPIPLTYLNFDNDLEKQEFTYNFSENVIVEKEDISFLNSKGDNIDFNITYGNKCFIIKPTSNLDSDDYSITVDVVTNAKDENSFCDDVPINNFNLNNPIKLLKVEINKYSNVVNYYFNKDILVKLADIKLSNEEGNLDNFDFIVNNNCLSVQLDDLKGGKYYLDILKVSNINNLDDYILNLNTFDFSIDGLKFINKNFNTYVNNDFNDFTFLFNKELESANVIIKNEDSILSSNFNIIDKTLILTLDDLLVDDMEYEIVITDISSLDGNYIESPLIFNFKTMGIITDIPIVDGILLPILNIFDIAWNSGFRIVILAIGLGVIFIISKWLWLKLKLWLRSV